MDKFLNAPVYNSENGKDFYKAFSALIEKPSDMETVALLSLIRLLIYLPQSIGDAIMSSKGALPLMINHNDDLVKKIVKLRLQEDV